MKPLPLPDASRPTVVNLFIGALAGGLCGAGNARSTSQAIARSKSNPFAARASSSSEGARVEPNTELRTSKGVMPSVRSALSSPSGGMTWGISVGGYP
jgi:hypothetical protein